MTTNGYRRFGELLVERNIISKHQLDEALHKQNTTMGHRKLGEILVRMGYLAKSHVTENLSVQLDMPIVRLSDREIPERIRSMV